VQGAAAAAPQRKPEPSGILSLITDLIALQRKKESIDQAIDSTNSLSEAANSIRAPLVAELRALMQKGDELSKAADTADPATLAQQKKELDALTAQFKQYSAAVLPLGKQAVLLDVYKRTLNNWESSVVAQHRSELKSLILRLVILGIVIGLIAGVSEVWRKATFRYIHDARRRYQFLLLRRIVVWIVIAIVVAFAFAAELGTLATFAGLLTAGVAVALQNVILSVAGYFFLIGRYGVRVGDRVQIGGVTGDVIDIGLVRIHIMEAISGASDVRPTGRVVVFSNSVVFQPNSGLFKQIPGTNFVWHEITLILPADSNYQPVEERLMDAVRKVYAEYQADMEAQRRRMEQSLTGVSIRPLGPESRLRLTQTGLEVVIRYPVVLDKAAAIDDEMTRALLDAIAREPRLRLVGTGTPNIQIIAEKAS
jgi:small-conductance mechanosensitive channel